MGSYTELEVANEFITLFTNKFLAGIQESARIYAPESPVRLLVLGESPPIGGRYIYSLSQGEKVRASSFPSKLLNLVKLSSVQEELKTDGQALLLWLKKQSVLVSDLLACPVDGFSNTVRAQLIVENIEATKKSLSQVEFSPSARVICALPTRTMESLRVLLSKNHRISSKGHPKDWLAFELASALGVAEGKVKVVLWSGLSEELANLSL